MGSGRLKSEAGGILIFCVLPKLVIFFVQCAATWLANRHMPHFYSSLLASISQWYNSVENTPTWSGTQSAVMYASCIKQYCAADTHIYQGILGILLVGLPVAWGWAESSTAENVSDLLLIVVAHSQLLCKHHVYNSIAQLTLRFHRV